MVLEKIENKYVYYEVHMKIMSDGTSQDIIILNENYLVNKPYTNSDGFWGFTNLTEHFGGSYSYHQVKQYWIDLRKFRFNKKHYKEIDKTLKIALSELRNK